MKNNEFCTGCIYADIDFTDTDICRDCADYQNKRYKEANNFAEKTAFINLILVWTCLALIAAVVGLIV